MNRNQYIPSEENPINIEIFEKETNGEEEEEDFDDDEDQQNDERYYQGLSHGQPQSSTLNQKILKKKKKNKNQQLKKQQQSVQNQNNDTNELEDQQNQICDQCTHITENNDVSKKKKKKKKKGSAEAQKGNLSLNTEIDLKITTVENESHNSAQTPQSQLRELSTRTQRQIEGKKKGPACQTNDELEQFKRRLEESYKNLKENQKIQPIISQNWILKIKERYAKLKVMLNK